MKTGELLGRWTREKLAGLDPRVRFEILEKAKNTGLGSAEARAELVEAIIASGPIFDSSAITNDDPMSLAMEDIVNSTAGRDACIDATNAGLPALAGVEPMIAAEIGSLYGEKYMATNQAGAIVAILMQSLNYVEVGKRKMPDGSVAKTAAFWQKRR